MLVLADLRLRNLVDDTPQWHQHFPRSRHTQYPTDCSYRSPLCLHLLCCLPQVAADHLYKKLCAKSMLELSICMGKMHRVHVVLYWTLNPISCQCDNGKSMWSRGGAHLRVVDTQECIRPTVLSYVGSTTTRLYLNWWSQALNTTA